MDKNDPYPSVNNSLHTTLSWITSSQIPLFSFTIFYFLICITSFPLCSATAIRLAVDGFGVFEYYVFILFSGGRIWRTRTFPSEWRDWENSSPYTFISIYSIRHPFDVFFFIHMWDENVAQFLITRRQDTLNEAVPAMGRTLALEETHNMHGTHMRRVVWVC